MEEGVVDFVPIDQTQDMYLVLLTRKGNLSIIRLDLEAIKIDGFEQKDDNSTREKKIKKKSLRLPKQFKIQGVETFNVWESAVQTNYTLYGETINNAISKGVE